MLNVVRCLMIIIVAALITTTFVAAAPIEQGNWALEHGGDLRSGTASKTNPSKRYGASLTAVGSHNMILFGGYFYDHPRSHPTWLCDLWSYDTFAHKWTRRRSSGSGPIPSYKHTITSLGNLVILFGGDDGGNSQHAKSHVWGSYSSLLYVLDTNTWRWHLPKVEVFGPKKKGGNLPPAARQGATMVRVVRTTQDGKADRATHTIVLFGGLAANENLQKDKHGSQIHDLNDVFFFTAAHIAGPKPKNYAKVPLKFKWEVPELATEQQPVVDETVPPPRRSHVAVANAKYPNKMFIVGGFSSVETHKNMNDVWEMTILGEEGEHGGKTPQIKWVSLFKNVFDATSSPAAHQAEDHQHEKSLKEDLTDPNRLAPKPRGGHVGAMANKGAIYISGGAHCIIGCKCLFDTWKFSIETRQWTRIEMITDFIPVARHFHSAAALTNLNGFASDDVDALYIFGGESYSPYGYWNDMWRLNISSKFNPTQSALPKSKWTAFFQDMPNLAANLMYRTRDAEMDETCSDREGTRFGGDVTPLLTRHDQGVDGGDIGSNDMLRFTVFEGSNGQWGSQNVGAPFADADNLLNATMLQGVVLLLVFLGLAVFAWKRWCGAMSKQGSVARRVRVSSVNRGNPKNVSPQKARSVSPSTHNTQTNHAKHRNSDAVVDQATIDIVTTDFNQRQQQSRGEFDGTSGLGGSSDSFQGALSPRKLHHQPSQ